MRKHLDFIKAHYEKVILSVVLIGLAAAAALMPMKVSAEQEIMEQQTAGKLRPNVKELEPIILTNAIETLARVAQPSQVELSGEHNVFNPVRWQKRPDGGIIRGTEAGISALRVTAIEPLMMRVSFMRVVGTEEPFKYEIGVLNETEGPGVRRRLGEVGRENNMFLIQAVRGPAQQPQEIDLVLSGERTPITITPDNPYERVVGYSADFYHDKHEQKWSHLKVGDELSFGGEKYNIVAITEDEAVLSAESNKKQTTIEFKPPQK